MAATEPAAGETATDETAADEAVPAGQTPASGEEPLTADLAQRPPRLSTRVLVALVVVLAVLLLASVVVALVVLHQPTLTPVPVPSVSSIA